MILCFGELLLRLTAPGRELLLQSGRFLVNEFITGSAGLQHVPALFRGMTERSAAGGARDIKTVIYPDRPAGGVQ